MRRTGSVLLTLVLVAVFCVAAVPIASACGGEGCTPGYWKAAKHADDWAATGLHPSDDFDTTFGVDFFHPDVTLGEALRTGGGGYKALARHGVAALLNATHPHIDYAYSAAEVMWLVQTGKEWAKNKLEYQNEMGCYF